MFGKQLNFLNIFNEAKQKNEPPVEKVADKVKESQVENRVEENLIEDSQIEDKAEDRIENRAEDKVEDKVEDKIEAQPEETSEELKLETQSKPESKSEAQSEFKPEAQLEPEVEQKSEEVEQKPRKGVFIKLIPGIKLPESELEIIRAQLRAKKDTELTPDDFIPLAVEINNYHERQQEIEAIFRQLPPGEEKSRQYSKKVFPEFFDDKEYLVAAELYMKYKKVCDDKIKSEKEKEAAEKARAEKERKEMAKAKKAEREKAKKEKAYQDFIKSQVGKNKKPSKSWWSKINKDEFDLDDGNPDPYGEIYPFSQYLSGRYKKKK